jgi:hypothetical protein
MTCRGRFTVGAAADELAVKNSSDAPDGRKPESGSPIHEVSQLWRKVRFSLAHRARKSLARWASRRNPRVSVVIATYDRPQVLTQCLRAVQCQTVSDWEVLVIGDCCKPSTKEAIEALGDPRIHYANLPARCGEQSIPNSVGLALARAPIVAFLNHDDYWLPDHLEIGLSRLDETKADLCTTTAVFAVYASQEGDEVSLAESSPTWRTLADVFDRPFFLFEPISSWLVRRESVLGLGPIGPAAALARPPITNWLLRIWRAGLRHTNEARVTVIKDAIRRPSVGSPHYPQPSLLFPYMAGIAAGRTADGMRARIACLQAEHVSSGRPVRDFEGPVAPRSLQESLEGRLTPDSALTFLATGRDPYDEAVREAGMQLGLQLRNALTRRTGERMPSPPDFDEMVQAARLQLWDTKA